MLCGVLLRGGFRCLLSVHVCICLCIYTSVCEDSIS